MKKTIRLTESDLHRVIKESVKVVLAEELYGPTCFSVQELAYNNQHIEPKLDNVIEFCETAAHILKNRGDKESVASFYSKLTSDLRDMKTHAFGNIGFDPND